MAKTWLKESRALISELNLVNNDAPYPHPGWFFAKSAESIENKRVEICLSAKKRRRVRNNLKRKGIARKHAGTLEGLKVAGWGGGGTPHYMHEFENKGVAKWVPRNCM